MKMKMKINKIKERIFPFIITFSALSVSASAAFYSITGLSMLFAGASTAVIIMASSLEIAKLVIASLLYQYWTKINKILRAYLTIASVILVLITSLGIYGYLSNAFQLTSNKSSIIDQQVLSLETKKKLFEETKTNMLSEKQLLTSSTSELRGALSKGSTTQYTDNKGNLVVRANNQGRKSFEKQLESTSKLDEKLTSRLDIVNDSIFSIEGRILEVKTNSSTTSELGPLKYLSTLTGYSMDRIINWLLLIIIFVFDPLAISLIIAANFAFNQLKKPLPPSEELNTPPEEPILYEAYEQKTEPITTPEDQTQHLKEILNRPDISGWRKNKIKQQLPPDDYLVKEY